MLLEERRAHRFTVAEYHELIGLGFFADKPRCELIEGEIIDMSPKGPIHEFTLRALSRRLFAGLPDGMIATSQGPVTMETLSSEPEPDLSVVRGVWESSFLDRHPEPPEVVLLIEVSDSTLRFDSIRKRRLYEAAQIAEYWVVDVGGRRVLRHRWDTESSGFLVSEHGDTGSLTVPGTSLDISIAAILPPPTGHSQ